MLTRFNVFYELKIFCFIDSISTRNYGNITDDNLTSNYRSNSYLRMALFQSNTLERFLYSRVNAICTQKLLFNSDDLTYFLGLATKTIEM